MSDEESLIQDINAFVQQQQTLILSTGNRDGKPLASYTPFVQDNSGNFYIFISDMAEHSNNIKHAEQHNAEISVLLIEDEQQSRNLFARKRLSYQCKVTFIGREDELWSNLINQFHERFGKIIELLSQLGDFHMYRLIPGRGNFVVGFGKAYSLEQGKIIHVTK